MRAVRDEVARDERISSVVTSQDTDRDAVHVENGRFGARLDGFDELLQATGVSQSDYLDRVVRFQQREADQGRPVAVLGDSWRPAGRTTRRRAGKPRFSRNSADASVGGT